MLGGQVSKGSQNSHTSRYANESDLQCDGDDDDDGNDPDPVFNKAMARLGGYGTGEGGSEEAAGAGLNGSKGHRQCVYGRVADLGSALGGKEPPMNPTGYDVHKW